MADGQIPSILAKILKKKQDNVEYYQRQVVYINGYVKVCDRNGRHGPGDPIDFASKLMKIY